MPFIPDLPPISAVWAVTTFKPSATFERGFKTGSPSKSGFTLRV